VGFLYIDGVPLEEFMAMLQDPVESVVRIDWIGDESASIRRDRMGRFAVFHNEELKHSHYHMEDAAKQLDALVSVMRRKESRRLDRMAYKNNARYGTF
jgi:glycyl-tRNA synthetase alpha subunit